MPYHTYQPTYQVRERRSKTYITKETKHTLVYCFPKLAVKYTHTARVFALHSWLS